MGTVIIGGGIIGLSTAYYLSKQRPSDPVSIIDSAPSLLLSASGFAGGFLAKDWFSPNVAALGELSFRLHRELADGHDGSRKWGYAPSTAYSLSIDGSGVAGRKTKKKVPNREWLEQDSSRAEAAWKAVNRETADSASGDGALRYEMLNADGTPAWITQQEGGSLDVISSDDGCAQVEPRELCEWLLEQCSEYGVEIHLNCQPLRLEEDEVGTLKRLIVKSDTVQKVIPCSDLVITAGAWTPKVFKTLFPSSKTKVRISPLAGYSVVVRSPRYSRPIVDPAQHDDQQGITGICHSIFCAPGPDWSYAPEVISRMTEAAKPEIYIAGLNDHNMPLPSTTAEVKEMMDDDKLEELHRTAVLLTGLSQEGDDMTEDDLEIIRQGLCFRPVSSTGQPIIAKLSNDQLGGEIVFDEGQGVFIAAGHGPWGISLSLGTGLVVAEMIQGLETSVNISQLTIR